MTPNEKAREVRRLRQCADILEQDMEELVGPHGAWIWPRTREVMSHHEMKQVREDYKVMVNGHIPIHVRGMAAHIRHTADLLEQEVTDVTLQSPDLQVD